MTHVLRAKWILFICALLAAGVALRATSTSSLSFPTAPIHALDSSQTSALAELARRAKELRIEVSTPTAEFAFRTRTHSVYGGPVQPGALELYARVLNAELRPYTAEILAKAGVRRIVLCTGLRLDQQARNGVPEFGSETLYLEAVRGMYALNYMRGGIHHEMFHMIDWRDDGLVYEDKNWKTLNPPGFAYFPNGGAGMQDDPYSSLPRYDRPGFLNRYSTSGVEEDKAEIFAALMTDPEMVKTRAENDPILRQKSERMKELCRKFCSEMDDRFWQNAAKN